MTVTVSGAATDAQQQEEVVTRPRYSVLDLQTNTVTLMSSRDLPSNVTTANATAALEQEFRALAERWYIETMPLSSYFDKILHPAYQKILTLDKPAVPLILRELQDEPNDWFWALRIITDDDPVPSEHAGDLSAMAEDWLKWGREKGYI